MLVVEKIIALTVNIFIVYLFIYLILTIKKVYDIFGLDKDIISLSSPFISHQYVNY